MKGKETWVDCIRIGWLEYGAFIDICFMAIGVAAIICITILVYKKKWFDEKYWITLLAVILYFVHFIINYDPCKCKCDCPPQMRLSYNSIDNPKEPEFSTKD